MGLPVLVFGKSGSGKSASLRNFKENELALINVLGKPLPFKNSIKPYVTDSYELVKNAIDKSSIDTIAIDDAGYLITNMFMNGHSTHGAGNAIFTFYNIIGDSFWSLVRHVVHDAAKNKIVYFFMHEDVNDFGHVKPKTIGKLLDEKVCLEGMFTIVLRAASENGRHMFLTKSKGNDVSKTPIGMFDSGEIDNDLKSVDAAIRDYYGMGGAINAKTN